MITRTIRHLLLLAMLPALAGAEAPAVNAKPEIQPYVLKNRSSFHAMSEEQRAPFWPIGWSRRNPVSFVSAAAPRVEAPKPKFDASSVKLTSILLGNPSLAIINGRSYSEGDYLRQPRLAADKPVARGGPAVIGAAAPRVRVYRINDGSIVLQNQDQLVMIALRRPELLQRSGVEELLTEDRP